MPIILVEDQQEYTIEGTTFLYERLRYDDRQKLLYLLTQRGNLDQTTYDTACVAVCLKGWQELYGKNGHIVFPGETHEGDGGPLLPGLSALEQQRLTAVYYVVAHLPLDIQMALVRRVNEFAPDELKKSLSLSLNDASPSSTVTPDRSLPAMTAVSSMPMSVQPPPVTEAGLMPVPTGAPTAALLVSL